MKCKLFALSGLLAVALPISAENPLRFNPENYQLRTLLMLDGTNVEYNAYEGIYYVTNIEDSTYQTLNYMFLVIARVVLTSRLQSLCGIMSGGYMASPAGTPTIADTTGRALAEGYVLFTRQSVIARLRI